MLFKSLVKACVAVFLSMGFSGLAQADIQFYCPSQIATIQRGVFDYLKDLKIPPELLTHQADEASGVLVFSLTTPAEDTRTLDLYKRPELGITAERVSLPTVHKGKMRVIKTVSKKEIMLALLQHGRITTFADKACSVQALSDRVGVRQNIVAWGEYLEWQWPDGGAAKWNTQYWDRGTPKPSVSLHAAVMDAFLHQDKYAVGCYAATKMVFIQGMLDFYNRVKRDPVSTRRVEEALLEDGDPLVDVEPGRMWSFEKDYDPAEMAHRGKILKLYSDVAAGNFVPGDWGYFVNTDPVSSRKIGYEGSNAIYLGSNRFDDYYNDNNHSYTYQQKIDEVYQWRNGVFSRQRDANKIQHLSPEEQAPLSNPPSEGGIQLDVRAVPRYF
jgi:hypothetical protein